MLRNRSRAVTSKQALMADHTSQSPSTQNCPKPISFFDSPRFKGFTFKSCPETEPAISPTSILEPFSPFKNPFCYDKNQPKSPKNLTHSWDKVNSKGIGIALIDDEKNNLNSLSKPSNKMVLFGTKLKVQIPPPSNYILTAIESPISPGDFGIKTKNSQISGCGSRNSGSQTEDSSPKVFTGCVSMSELELSEDYTCVISYGPNPKTTHIFENCVLENYGSYSETTTPRNFLSFCHTCNKNLQQKVDIFIYRGEKAFCSQECRYQEMVLDEIEN
ncbi:FCS-Like Zinc finger 8-like [Mercurialis annua]|uniref:FCS-Like Zinc finger 8-like n=1 Tax=Mercurialis annua TaxID=3986 RepID=UPI002160C7F8|nr:FCS-Like Zinc finger 8-like [Mercurialis annua]